MINQRVTLNPSKASSDPEAQWAVHYKDDGLELIRPAARLYIPYEMVPVVIKALRRRPTTGDE